MQRKETAKYQQFVFVYHQCEKGNYSRHGSNHTVCQHERPVLALFRLLGVETRKEAMQTIVGSHHTTEYNLLSSILDNDPTADMSAETLYEYIGKEGTR